MDKQVWFSAAVRAIKAFYPGPLSVPRESHHNFWEIESRHSEGRAPHAGGNGQRVHRECSCGNRLNKLVIHTPTAACGCQKEKEKKKSVIMERWKDLSFSKCSLVCFLELFAKNVLVHQLENKPMDQLDMYICMYKMTLLGVN